MQKDLEIEKAASYQISIKVCPDFTETAYGRDLTSWAGKALGSLQFWFVRCCFV